MVQDLKCQTRCKQRLMFICGWVQWRLWASTVAGVIVWMQASHYELWTGGHNVPNWAPTPHPHHHHHHRHHQTAFSSDTNRGRFRQAFGRSYPQMESLTTIFQIQGSHTYSQCDYKAHKRMLFISKHREKPFFFKQTVTDGSRMCLLPDRNWHTLLRANQAYLFLLFYDSAIFPPATGNDYFMVSYCIYWGIDWYGFFRANTGTDY